MVKLSRDILNDSITIFKQSLAGNQTLMKMKNTENVSYLLKFQEAYITKSSRVYKTMNKIT